MGRGTANGGKQQRHDASSSTEARLLLPAAAGVLLVALVLMVPRPRSGATTTSAAASREHAAYVLGDSPSVRAAQARALLQGLVEDGAVLHAPVQLAEHAKTGLGIYAATKMVRGQPIFTLPARHLIRPVADGIGAAAVLVQEQRQASSKAMQLYIASLPRECPANIAARSRTASDLALVALSLHAWKTELLRAELSYLSSALVSDAAVTPSEAEWATCMLMSRAFGVDDDAQMNKAAGHGVVMVPFVDLLKCAPELIASLFSFLLSK